MLTEYQITLDSNADRVCGIVYSLHVCVAWIYVYPNKRGVLFVFKVIVAIALPALLLLLQLLWGANK